ncbi:hypothetical protein J26TS2_41220 [Shouchella clausii]|nr:hypothetical protein J26TS2_41220 [Shouchella clausii]
MKRIGNLLIITGLIVLGAFVYQLMAHERAQDKSLVEAKAYIEKAEREWIRAGEDEDAGAVEAFRPDAHEAFATLEIPKLDRTIAVVEGTNEEALKNGVGHLSESAFPGQDEQILLSGHRDTVFRNFGELEIGDSFIVTMPYGKFTYELKETKIVSADDTSVIRKMGEEVLVITTCYPFHYVGSAPERFVIYAYPTT